MKPGLDCSVLEFTELVEPVVVPEIAAKLALVDTEVNVCSELGFEAGDMLEHGSVNELKFAFVKLRPVGRFEAKAFVVEVGLEGIAMPSEV